MPTTKELHLVRTIGTNSTTDIGNQSNGCQRMEWRCIQILWTCRKAQAPLHVRIQIHYRMISSSSNKDMWVTKDDVALAAFCKRSSWILQSKQCTPYDYSTYTHWIQFGCLFLQNASIVVGDSNDFDGQSKLARVVVENSVVRVLVVKYTWYWQYYLLLTVD